MKNRYYSVAFCLFFLLFGQVKAQGSSTCALPTDIHVSFIAGGSALVSWSWSADSLPTQTIVRHRVDGQTVWTETPVSDTCLMLTNLMPHTRYEATILAVCGVDTTVSEPFYFLTLPYLECIEADPNPIVITGSTQLDVSSYPITGGNTHSYMEQIVRANELSPDGSPLLLTGVSFQYKSPYPLNTKEHVEIYLTHREDSVYHNSTDFTPLANASLVYVGDFHCQLGWNYFEFSTPFYYDGVQNLVIFVIDKTVNSSSTTPGAYYTFGCHRKNNEKVSLNWITTSILDLNNPFLPSTDNIRNNMRFSVCSHSESVACAAPNIYHHEWSNDTMTVCWASGLNDSVWVLRYRMLGDGGWTYDSMATSPYKIYTQSPDNIYGIELQSKCSDSLYSVWKSPFSTSDSPCLPVSNVTLSSVGEQTAVITWVPGGDESFWTYFPVANFTTPAPPPAHEGWIATTSPLVLDSLAEGHCHHLWIRAGCGAGNFSSAEPFEFWTSCHEIDHLPYTEDFNNPEDTIYLGAQNSGPLPHCWQKLSPYLNSGPYCTSDSCLTFYSTNNEYKVAILPRLSNDLLVSHLKMSFDCKKLQYYYPSSLIVGVMDDPTDLSSFTPVDTVYTPDINWWDWHHREVFFENYTGTGHYIALKYQNSSQNYFKVDNLTIDTAFTCHTPTNLMATSISTTSVYMTWEDEDDEGEWQVAVVPDYLTNPDSGSIVTVHEKHYLATNVTDSNQVFFVRTHCANGWGCSEWVSLPIPPFSHEPATVPYSHNFENGDENAAWRMETGNPVSRWQIGIPNGYSDSLLFVTNNGSDASYGSTLAEAWAYRDFQLSGATEYEIRFRWLCNGHSSYAYMQAMVGEPAPILVSTNYFDDVYPEGSVLIGKYARQNDWKTTRYVLGSENDNTVQRLYFRWRNVYNSVYPPGAVIDNIQIVPYHCSRPVDVTFEGATAHEADISFSSTGTEQTAWQYVIGTGDYDPDTVSNLVTVQGTSIQLMGLQASTTYTLYVRSVCDNGYFSAWSEGVTFQTLCEPLVLPYYEDFTPGDNHSSNLPDCWSALAPETGIHSPSIYVPHAFWEIDSNAVLRFGGIGPSESLAILPEVPSDYSLNSLRLSFLMRSNTDSIHLIVGVMSDPDDFSTFIPVDTVQTVEPFYLDCKEVFFDHYQGSGTYIAILSDYVGDNTCHLDLDDLVLEIAPTCLAPSGLKAINMGQNSVTLSWTPANGEQTWEIAYGTDNFNPDSTENICVANTNPFTLTGLSDGTFYGFYVRAVCSPGEYSEWSPLGYAFTRCAPVSVVGQPYQESFDSYTTGISTSLYTPIEYPYISYPDCWSFLNLHALVGYPDWTLPAAFLSNKSTLIVWGNSLHLVNSKVTPLYAVLPEFVEHTRFLKLTFSYKYAILRSTLSVGYMTDPSDGNTYHEVQFCQNSNSNNFTTLTIDYSTLGLDPDSNYYIAFRSYDPGFGWANVAIENVKVELVPNAFPAPTQLNVSDITTNSAVLDWTNGNDENHWVVQYRLATSPDWTDSVDVYSHPVFLDSLTSNTVYDVRVKSVYGDIRTMCSDYTTTDFTTLDDTSVPDYDDFGQHVTIRPNPAKQFIDVDLDETLAAEEILLYNAYGQWIKTIPIQNHSTRISLEELSAGVYFIRVVGETGTATKRFIKE